MIFDVTILIVLWWTIRKVMTNLGSMLKSRDITLPTKVHLVKAMVFPVVMYGCENWTVKKAECRRIDAFELWYWRRLLRVPWSARISNQSILKEISPGCSLQGLMLKLKLQYFGHLVEELILWKRPWCWEGLGAGGEGYDRGWDGWMASPIRWAWVWVDSGSWWWTGRPGVLWFMGLQRVGHDWATELNWTELRWPPWLCGLWDVSSWTRDWTHNLASESSELTTERPENSPAAGFERIDSSPLHQVFFFFFFYLCQSF